MDLNLYQFNGFDMAERAAYLWEHGEYITGVIDTEGRSNYYALHGYFVEVELFDQGDAIAAVITFSEGARYERMVSGVDLPTLD